MCDMTLSESDLAQIQRVLSASADTDPASLLPHPVIDAVAQLIPCDVIGVAMTDDRGNLIAGQSDPADAFADLGPQVCDGPLPVGVCRLSAGRGDDPDAVLTRALGFADCLRLGFVTGNGTVTQLVLDRRRRAFSDRDEALLALLEPVLARLAWEHSVQPHRGALSPAELRVLELVALGGSNVEIARRLCVSVATVRKHLEHVYRKLGVTNRTAAVAALSNGALVG